MPARLNFKDPNAVIYTAENGNSYSTNEIVKLCKGSVAIAFDVAQLCEWQDPSTIIDEMLREEDIEEIKLGNTTTYKRTE